jgi:DNA-binding transcriptional MerR regulator
MAVSIPEKAYFRIGEVSKILGVAPYVIRYWETEFKTVRPIRASSAQRLYRKKDVEELLIIKDLLYTKNFTISGARKHMAEIKGKEAVADGDRKRLAAIKKGLLEIRDSIKKGEIVGSMHC